MKIHNKALFTKLPDVFLLDIDNTLYPYDPAHHAAYKEVRTKVVQTFNISNQKFDQAFAEAKHQVKLQLGNTAAAHSRLLYLQRMMEIMGLGSQVLLALDFEQTYWRTFLRNAVLFDDVKEFLDDLRFFGITTAAITDLSAHIQFRKIIYLELDSHFDYIISSEEAGADKPNALPFKLALQKIQPAGDCIWLIGDNPINDIAGGRDTINAITLQKIHAGVVVGSGTNQADAIFNDFSELRQLIAKLSNANGSKL
jgi:putative hydrolase of the HAD superfamily